MPDAPNHVDVRAPARPPSVAPPPLQAEGRGTSWNVWRAAFATTLAVALVEVIGHYTVQSRVVPERDWAAVADLLRAEVQPTDTILVAPDWASPVARRGLGDLMTEARVAYSDLAGFTRAFEVSARGHRHPDLAGREPTSVRRVGALTLREYALGESPVLFDLTSAIEQAHVSVRGRGGVRPCGWRSASPGRGGLGAGPMMPEARFECDPRHPWVFVGRTVNEDLELRPRRCVWQHPAEAGSSVVTTFEDVPLGARLVLYAGLYYEHERMLEHPPFDLRVHVEGREVAHMTHRDGDGWKRIEASTGPANADPTRRGQVQIEVSAENPHLRSVCWHADLRTAERQHNEERP